MLIENHIVYKYCEGIEDIDFAHQQLYRTLEDKFNFIFDWARRTYKVQISDEMLSEKLDVDLGSAIMYLDELYHLVGDIPVEYTKAWINAELFHISTIIDREDEKSEPPEIHR